MDAYIQENKGYSYRDMTNSIGLTLIQIERAPHHVEERGLVFPSVKTRLNILNLRRKQGKITQMMRNM